MDTATLTEEVAAKTIPIYIMGKKYEVPETLTIMKAMEHSGYQYIRGCGCRGGICGACATIYRRVGDYKIYTGLACQTVVEPEMYLTQIPFYPANRASYDFESAKPTAETIYELYPELFRCVACNSCTKVCPMGNSLLDIIVFGRIAGTTAAEFIADGVKDGTLTLEHVVKYNAEVEKAGITDGRVAPAIIPDYTEAEVRERQLTANFVGNVR